MRTTHNTEARTSVGTGRLRDTSGRARTGPEALLLTRILWLISADETPAEPAAASGGAQAGQPGRSRQDRGGETLDVDVEPARDCG
jgi:hypothetical protein